MTTKENDVNMKGATDTEERVLRLQDKSMTSSVRYWLHDDLQKVHEILATPGSSVASVRETVQHDVGAREEQEVLEQFSRESAPET